MGKQHVIVVYTAVNTDIHSYEYLYHPKKYDDCCNVRVPVFVFVAVLFFTVCF